MLAYWYIFLIFNQIHWNIFLRYICLDDDGLNPTHVPYWWVNKPKVDEFGFPYRKSWHERIKKKPCHDTWLPHDNYPCGTFLTPLASNSKRLSVISISHDFTICICTKNQNQMSFYPFVPDRNFVLVELIVGHLCYLLTYMPTLIIFN